jgi:hypothetical protein
MRACRPPERGGCSGRGPRPRRRSPVALAPICLLAGIVAGLLCCRCGRVALQLAGLLRVHAAGDQVLHARARRASRNRWCPSGSPCRARGVKSSGGTARMNTLPCSLVDFRLNVPSSPCSIGLAHGFSAASAAARRPGPRQPSRVDSASRRPRPTSAGCPALQQRVLDRRVEVQTAPGFSVNTTWLTNSVSSWPRPRPRPLGIEGRHVVAADEDLQQVRQRRLDRVGDGRVHRERPGQRRHVGHLALA